jgi:hypothetical protein
LELLNLPTYTQKSTKRLLDLKLVADCHGIHPRSLNTDWNQACTAGSSTILVPTLIGPDDYLVAERTHKRVYRLLVV